MSDLDSVYPISHTDVKLSPTDRFNDIMKNARGLKSQLMQDMQKNRIVSLPDEKYFQERDTKLRAEELEAEEQRRSVMEQQLNEFNDRFNKGAAMKRARRNSMVTIPEKEKQMCSLPQITPVKNKSSRNRHQFSNATFVT